MRLTDLLNLSNVPRWGIVPRFKDQSVADHTFRVAVIAWELADRLGVTLSGQDFCYILCHDGEESWTGDISGLSKHAIPELEMGSEKVKAQCPWMRDSPSPLIHAIVKAADILDCLVFAHYWIPEPRRSYIIDRNVAVLNNHCARYTQDYPDLPMHAHQILRNINEDQGRCSTPEWLHDRRESRDRS